MTGQVVVIQGTISGQDYQDLRQAKWLLEHPGLVSRLQDVIGQPLELGAKMLPPKWQAVINKATRTALEKALDFAVGTMDDDSDLKASNRFHRMLVAASGAAGGALGLPALPLELPVSTVIMLRSIADIARAEGESLDTVEARLACLEVFAFGGRTEKDDSSETGYYAIRTVLALQLSEAMKVLASGTAVGHGAPAVARFLASISSRFGVVVSQKMAAGAIPVIGAAGGAMINALFLSHFQDMARGHFVVRRLERKYGEAAVAETYRGIHF